MTLTPHPLLVLRSKIEYSYTSTLPKGLHGLCKGETYLHFINTPLNRTKKKICLYVKTLILPPTCQPFVYIAFVVELRA